MNFRFGSFPTRVRSPRCASERRAISSTSSLICWPSIRRKYWLREPDHISNRQPTTKRPKQEFFMRSFIRWIHSLAYVVKGARAMRKGDDDGVISTYSRAIEISPEDLDYYYARGHAHWHKR